MTIYTKNKGKQVIKSMSKIVVLFRSKTGYTRRYAEWIAKALNCDLIENKRLRIEQLENYDTIIIGGYVHAGTIQGVDFIMKNWKELKKKNIIMFTVGLKEASVHKIEKLWKRQMTTEQLDKMKMFYLRGGFDLQKLGFINSILMKMFRFVLHMKKNAVIGTTDVLGMFEHPVDFTCEENIEPIINAVKRICD